jgi:purine-binding chemotaxis protein CheW
VSVSCLLVEAGSGLCALPIADVVELLRPRPVEPLPGAPAFVLGVSVIRGEAVPVVGLARLLGAGGPAPSRFVTVRAGDRRLALAVDRAPGVRAIDAALLDRGRALAAEIATAAVAAIAPHGDRVLRVLACVRVLPDDAWATIDRAAEASRG